MRCRRCGVEYRNLAHYCRACYDPVALQRAQVIRAVHAAIRRGELPHPKTQVCVDCGKPGFDYDHRDYDRPLDVEAVCRRCNQRRGPAKQLFPLSDEERRILGQAA